ncbi:MAG TPA: alpha/beta hydrolase [Steroidobacteraceae bacterium]|nr:alpha/beta hydrolase [Steroidobacteraceae bacterium]
MNGASIDHFHESVDGLRLYCRVDLADRPGGATVLCLPGLTRNGRDFQALAQHLRGRHDVLAADLRGRGRSAWDPNPANYQIATYVQDAWSLLDSRAVARAIIIGTSLGALMGMVMAATRPERIAGVVLNDAGAQIDPAGLRRIASYAGKLPPVSTWAQAAAQTKAVYGAALPGLNDDEWMAYTRRGYREDASGAPVPDMDPKIAHAFGDPSTINTDLWSLFAQIHDLPMLVIRGAASDLLSAATVMRMARENRALRYATVPNRGHAPLLDEPECIEAIDAFFDRLVP